ncbi:MAG: isochorismatase family protein, partial [Anaerolineales bacterium]
NICSAKAGLKPHLTTGIENPMACSGFQPVTHGCVRATCRGARQLGYEVKLVMDGHSNYSKQAARLIDKWNQKLSAINVKLLPTAEIKFI